ncbi:MAG TPA: HAMP domain-containing sensor histidine kinase [Phycisphaerae bacterium]|nr:HAMP domain-containing histidine kinase [Phycisphaerales bacterium]HRX83937.1 HAMP domain-containing sensor histidine kinase [Phycisphaerae bacterium]
MHANDVGSQAQRFAHDFRNLLLVAETRLELAQMDSADHPGAVASLHAARQALTQARDLVRLLDDLALDSAAPRKAVVLAEVVRGVIQDVRGVLPPNVGLQCTLPVEAQLPVCGDALQLSRLVRNLLINARDAMPEGGQLRVALESSPAAGIGFSKEPQELHLIVADTGVGMDAETCSRIFEPFFTTRTSQGGTGLGLSIVEEIASAHGARIAVTSAPGTGTTFTISFPACTAALAVAAPPAPAGMVLVVGADKGLRQLAGVRFGAVKPEIRFACGSREALRVMERQRGAVRCLVVDAESVPADEVATLRALRSWRGRRGLVLLMPAGAPARRAAADGSECVVKRPLGVGDLERSVRRMLESLN